ncbi:MAG: deoxynucleoside kinase [Gammaproteobacteria bacterium]|nr:deoxynucleoside kinase [Gammaproteobacteria bacterium]
MLLERVEIAGCIASGKTTLVRALEGQFRAVYENHRVNPFWKSFYRDPSAYTFETEITFLLQHYHFAKLGALDSRKPVVLDHSFELDLAYARVGLEGSRRRLFESIYGEIQDEVGFPRAIVIINCTVEVLARRIQERGRSFEVGVPLEFLSNLQCELERRIDELQGSVKIIRVDSEHTDFRREGDELSRLVSMIGSQAE